MTLGLGIITRNSDVKLLDTALASIFGHVDAIYITVADKEKPSDEVKAIADKYNANLSHFEWCDDFSKARNFNMELCKEDWYTWLDTDDTVRGMENARAYLSKLPASVKYLLCTYNYAFYPSGEVATKHPKERFIKMGEGFVWKGSLHETCVTEHMVDGLMWDDVVWDHHTDDERSLESSRRNVRVIEQELKEQAKDQKIDPRSVFNLGMAYAGIAQRTMTLNDWRKAIRAFQHYLSLSGWDEHAYMAWKFIGIGYIQINRPELAVDCFTEALKLHPEYADAYASLGSAYDRLNDFKRAEAWYKLAVTTGEENKYAHDVGTAYITPLASLARIFALKGNVKEAEVYIKKAIKTVGKGDANLNGLAKEIRNIKKQLRDGEKTVAKLESLPSDEAKAAYEALPNDKKSLPVVVRFRRKMKWKTETNGREITIFTGQSWEEWNPESAKTGIGGSEEAVICLAKELKTRGWDVTVYGSNGTEAKDYDGVLYKPWWEFGVDEPCDIFIGWRDPGVFEYKINAKKTYLWLHDVVPHQSITPARLANITKVITLSKYHRGLFPNVPDEKMLVSANGIIPSHFEVEGLERNPKRILYTSAPNRGLLALLELWPKIKERVPDAEFHWAYGWQSFDKGAEHNPQMQAYKQVVLSKLQQPGVIDHGRIGHEELAKLMLSGGVWAYPTEFPEIFCITAIKMQAAGCIPVTTTVAALDEVVQFGTKIDVKDFSTNVEAQAQFLDSLVKAIEEGGDRKEMQEWARANWTWGKVADQWNNEFKS